MVDVDVAVLLLSSCVWQSSSSGRRALSHLDALGHALSRLVAAAQQSMKSGLEPMNSFFGRVYSKRIYKDFEVVVFINKYVSF